MQAPLTYTSTLAYLVGLGKRFRPIGRAEITLTGEARGTQPYPLVLVEGDAQGSEIIGSGGQATGQDTFTVAIQVLTKGSKPTTAQLVAMLAETNIWADRLAEMLRSECRGQLWGVNKLSLPGQAGTDLACGWRVELTLKLVKDIEPTTNAEFFTPETV